MKRRAANAYLPLSWPRWDLFHSLSKVPGYRRGEMRMSAFEAKQLVTGQRGRERIGAGR